MKNQNHSEQVHVLRLDKGNEHYVFMYTKQYLSDMVRQMGKWAQNPELSFSTDDMKRIAREMRHE